MSRFAISCGDINGIGLEIIIKALNKLYAEGFDAKFIVYCPHNAFTFHSSIIEPQFNFKIVENPVDCLGDYYLLVLRSKDVRLNIGKPTKTSGAESYASLQFAFNYARENNTALITAPISKISLKLAGIKFSGHTEILASWTNSKKYLMTFLSDELICALNTIHEPIKKIPSLTTERRILNSLEVLIDSLKNDLRINIPRIAVLGLNPHAGEKGNIGREEESIIKAIKKHKNIVFGPYPSDAFFGNKKYKNFDAVLAMYHDQGLIPFKMLSFEKGINFTAGLPIIRTSPDHGTAFDIAGENKANPDSLYYAIKWAKKIAKNRNK